MQVLKTPYIQSTIFNLPKIDTAKIIRAVTVVALAAIATHMLTNLPGASAFDVSATNPAMAAADPGVLDTIKSGASSFLGGTANLAYNLLSRPNNAPTYHNTANPTINPIIKGCDAVAYGGNAVAQGGAGGNAVATIHVPEPGIQGAMTSTGAFTLGIGSLLGGGGYVYSIYDAKDDGPLLEQIQLKDCGGLSKMAPETEGCYRQYLSDAIVRISPSNYREKIENLRQRCFEDRPIHECT